MATCFSDDIKCIVDNARDELVEKLTMAIKEEAGKQININEIIKQVDVVHLVRQAVYDHFRQSVANEIGNRLRCGIYDGTKIEKLFEEVWTSELDKAIKDRIRERAYKAVDNVIAEWLKKTQHVSRL